MDLFWQFPENLIQSKTSSIKALHHDDLEGQVPGSDMYFGDLVQHVDSGELWH